MAKTKHKAGWKGKPKRALKQEGKKAPARRKAIIKPKDPAKHAEKRADIDKTEVTWQRLFALRDNHRVHEAKAKEHAKTEKEAAEEYKLPDLTVREREKIARREKEAKNAKNECLRVCKRNVQEILHLLDGAENGEFLSLKNPGSPLAPPPENPAAKPEDPSGKLPYDETADHWDGEDFTKVLRRHGVAHMHMADDARLKLADDTDALLKQEPGVTAYLTVHGLLSTMKANIKCKRNPTDGIVLGLTTFQWMLLYAVANVVGKPGKASDRTKALMADIYKAVEEHGRDTTMYPSEFIAACKVAHGSRQSAS